jgi:hypothetical protein
LGVPPRLSKTRAPDQADEAEPENRSDTCPNSGFSITSPVNEATPFNHMAIVESNDGWYGIFFNINGGWPFAI